MNQTFPRPLSPKAGQAVQMQAGEAFGVLRQAKRVWAVAAIHADIGRLREAHQELAGRLLPGDRLVYLGNMIGQNPATLETLDELVGFRRDFLCLPGAEPEDIVYLRGAQEEMWRKLLQIQFAPGPGEVYAWMLKHGLEPVLTAYGVDLPKVPGILREGAIGISRWTNGLRAALRRHPGHDDILASLKRAAYTEGGELLFVHAGLDPALPLAAQADQLWWGAAGFAELAQPYGGFRLVVAGASPQRGAQPFIARHAACIDGGAGQGGPLNVACFALDATLADSFAI